MFEAEFDEAVERIRSKDPRYHREAYVLVRRALDYTQDKIGRARRRRPRHVSGQELLVGIREYALAKYGPMAKMLLEEWGVRSCPDFGEIVFNLIDVGLFGKTEEDSRADFACGYDFFEAFRRPFLPKAALAARQDQAAAQQPELPSADSRGWTPQPPQPRLDNPGPMARGEGSGAPGEGEAQVG